MTTRTEIDVGITEYISKHNGFKGIIKARYQDFVVHEISSDGRIVHLDKLTFEEKETEVSNKSFENVLSDEDKKKLSSLLHLPDDQFVMLKAGKDKQERGNIHISIREIFPELESATISTADGEVQIKVSKGKLNNRKQHQSRKKYCKFVMYKEYIDTMTAVNHVAKKTRIRNSKMFQYAGTKDKRAITVQEVTVPINHERLLSLANLESTVCLGNFSYCDKPLHLGDLRGNHFKIVLRNIDGDKEQIDMGMASFESTGFINYFGMQRFGTTEVPTYEIGISVLKGDWEKVICLILNEHNKFHTEDMKNAMKKYNESKDATKALGLVEDKRCIEACLLRGLIKFGPNQLAQAFNLISRNVRLLYLHSFQSLIWNKVASNRIAKYGIKPIEGDFVLKDQYESYLADKETDNPAAKKRKVEMDNSDNELYRTHKRSLKDVVSLKSEDIEHFTINDVLLPLPGHSVTYPIYNNTNLYEDLLSEHDLNCKKSFVNKTQEYSLPGVYRNLIIKPMNVKHEIMFYNSCKDSLILTDKSVLNKATILPSGGKFRALKVEFSLPPSSYATVAVREVLKSDLSAASQNKMTIDHVQECIEEEGKKHNH